MEEGEIEDGEIEDDLGESTVVEKDEKSVTLVGLDRENSASLGVGQQQHEVTSVDSKRGSASGVRKENNKPLGLDSSSRKRPYHGSAYTKRSQKPAHRTDNYRGGKHYENGGRNRNRQSPRIRTSIKRPQHDVEVGYWMDETGSKFVEQKSNGSRREGSRRASKNEGSFKKSKKNVTNLPNSRERNSGGEGPLLYLGNNIPHQSGSHTKAKDPDDFEELLKEYRRVSEAIVREKEKIKQTEKEVIEEEDKKLSLQILSTTTSRGSQDPKKLGDVTSEQTLTKDKDENDEDDELLELRLAALTSLAQKEKDEKENKCKPNQDSLPKKTESLPSFHSTKKKSATSRRSTAVSRSRNRRRSIRPSRQRARSATTSLQGTRLRTTKDILSIDDEEERINQFLLYLKETPEARDIPGNKEADKVAIKESHPNSSTTAALGDDNYEEVEMEIDEAQESEEKIEMPILTAPEPATSSALTTQIQPPIPDVPPPLPSHTPPLPIESNLPKPPEPEEDEDEEEILALRQLLLKNMKQKMKTKVIEVKVAQDSKVSQTPSPTRTPRSESPTMQKPTKKKQTPVSLAIPVHEEVVINLKDDSDSSDDENNTVGDNTSTGYNTILDQFLKEARKKADADKPKNATEAVPRILPKTPDAMKQLSTTQQAEYKRLKEEIAKREKNKMMKVVTAANQSPIPSDMEDPSQDEGEKKVKQRTLTVTFVPKGDVERQIGMKEVDGKIAKNDNKSNGKNKEKILKKDPVQIAEKEAEKIKQNKIKMVEEKLTKFRSVIEKEENTFEDANQRLGKKTSVLKLAMTKISKLKEQLATVQGIADANKNSIIKIHEEKNALSSRLKQLKVKELRLLKALADMKGVPLGTVINSHRIVKNSMGKRAAGTIEKSHEPIKRQRLTSARETVLAKERSELIRLQALEKMYAEKIAKFKESHNQQRQKLKRMIASPAVSKVLQEANLSMNIKPSKQLYLKDKINIPVGSGMVEDVETRTEVTVPRRRSWLDETSTTKPSLSTSSSPQHSTKGSANELGNNVPKTTKTVEEDKTGIFNAKELEKLKKLQERREKVLRYFDWTASINASVSKGETPVLPSDIKVELAIKKNTAKDEVKVMSLKPYESPLLPWNVYRFSALFKQLSSESLGSETFCNKINPSAIFCRFDLNGRCNDDDCKWQHERDCKMTFEEILAHLVSYDVSIVGATDKSTLQQIQRKVWLFAKMKCQDLKKHSEEEKQEMMEKVMNLVFSKPQRAPSRLEPRRWKVTQRNKKTMETENEAFMNEDVKITSESATTVNLVDPDYVDEDDLRYFSSDVGMGQLENAVLQNPHDIQLWLKLAYKQLSKPGNDNVDKALHALSRGLDSNRNDPELWLHYLTLYNKRCTNHEDVMEMCNHGIHYTQNYDVWHKTLSFANSLESIDEICKDLLQALQEEQQTSPTDRGSHRLLEMLLYRSHLYCLVGKGVYALEILKDCVFKTNGMALVDLLSTVDKCLAWLSFIHLKYFKQLPPSLFDPNSSAPSRLVSKELFICPWTKSSITMLDEIQKDLQDAVECCHSKEHNALDNTLACWSLHKNLVQLYVACDSPEKAVSFCRGLLKDCPGPELWILLMKTMKLTCDIPTLNQVVEECLACNKQSACVYLMAASFAFKDANIDLARSLLHRCVTSYYKEHSADHDAITLYRKLLNQPVPYISQLPHYADDVKEVDLKTQRVHLWMCYALLLEINGDKTSAGEAYEVALCDLDKPKDVQTVWFGYLQFHLRKMSLSTNNTIQDMQTWHELINRCLMTSPCQFPVPYNTSKNWLDYTFHNQVLNLYIATIKEQDKLDVFERLLSMMPRNTLLLLRVCQYAVLAERPQQAFIHCTTFLRDQPHCIQAWKVAIHLQLITKNYKQVRHLYSRALASNPLVAQLWINLFLFLVAHGNNSDVDQTINNSLKHGVNLKEKVMELLAGPR